MIPEVSPLFQREEGTKEGYSTVSLSQIFTTFAEHRSLVYFTKDSLCRCYCYGSLYSWFRCVSFLDFHETSIRRSKFILSLYTVLRSMCVTRKVNPYYDENQSYKSIKLIRRLVYV